MFLCKLQLKVFKALRSDKKIKSTHVGVNNVYNNTYKF